MSSSHLTVKTKIGSVLGASFLIAAMLSVLIFHLGDLEWRQAETIFNAFNVANEADVIAMFHDVHNALGPIRGVVINAGIVAPAAKLIDMSAERMRRVLEVNVLGALLTAREAARWMSTGQGGEGGAIVLVSSAAARLGSPNLYVDYAATKGAIDTLTRGLSIELAPEGVRVNTVRPGMIDTEIHVSGGDPDRANTIGATAPLGRPGKPEEVAEAIAFLLDDQASSYVTGAILDVTGGR